MNKLTILSISIIILAIISFSLLSYEFPEVKDTGILSHIVDLKKQNLKFYYKDKNGKHYSNFQNLKTELLKQDKHLVFAVNGGMYKKDQSPQGLFIQKGITLSELDTLKTKSGNFYMQPNGVFYITTNKTVGIVKTPDFKNVKNIEYATQSGPILLIDGKMHKKINKGSANVHIRNGVGLLPNGNLLFAMSKEKINFYDFASYFKRKGCKNALYLDGFVSKTYLPSKQWEQVDGTFGVIIAEAY